MLTAASNTSSKPSGVGLAHSDGHPRKGDKHRKGCPSGRPSSGASATPAGAYASYAIAPDQGETIALLTKFLRVDRGGRGRQNQEALGHPLHGSALAIRRHQPMRRANWSEGGPPITLLTGPASVSATCRAYDRSASPRDRGDALPIEARGNETLALRYTTMARCQRCLVP